MFFGFWFAPVVIFQIFGPYYILGLLRIFIFSRFLVWFLGFEAAVGRRCKP